MSQYDFAVIDPNVKTGTQLAADLNQWRDALHSSHAGVARPAYVKPGMLWVEQVSAALWRLRLAGNTGDSIVGQIDPVANAFTVLHPDGTLALPGITFANEPSMGLFRGGAGVLNVAVGGVVVAGIRSNSFTFGAAVAVNIAATLAVSSVTSTLGLTVTGGILGVPNGANTVGVANNQIAFRGPSGGNYGAPAIGSADPTGAPNIVYKFNPNPASSAGYHLFNMLAGAGDFRIFGGAFGTGNGGASLVATYNNVNVGGIDMPVLDGTPGSQKSEIRFAYMKNGVFDTAGDVVLRKNPSVSTGQLVVNGARLTIATIAQNCPLVIDGKVSGDAALGFINNVNGNFILCNSGNFYFAQQDGTGPYSGWMANISVNTGVINAGGFNPVSDRSLKDKIRPLGASLSNVLRLQGVRYFNRFSKREDIGLVAQDVEPTYPEFVVANDVPVGNDETVKVYTLNYMGLIAPIIEAIRELNARVIALEGGPK